jgi:hypothetical protein
MVEGVCHRHLEESLSMKRLSLLAVPLLMIGLLAGCGDDSSSAATDEPTSSASTSSSSEPSSSAAADGGTVQAFCSVLIGIAQPPPEGTSDAEALKLLKSVAAQLEAVGTPEDMPEDAARALQTAIDKINDLPDDATKQEVSKAATDLSTAEKKDQVALGNYVQEKCMGALPSAPSSPAN